VGKICELQVKPLEAIMAAPLTVPLHKNSVSDPVLYLDRLSDVFRHVAPSNGCIGRQGAHKCSRNSVCLLSGQAQRCLPLGAPSNRCIGRQGAHRYDKNTGCGPVLYLDGSAMSSATWPPETDV
jgi:hypothetical protein